MKRLKAIWRFFCGDPAVPTGNPGIAALTPQDEMVRLLKSIDGRLAKIEQASHHFERCLTTDNHQRKFCVRTGHWND